MDQTVHRVATKERQEIEGTTKQKMTRRQSKEGGNHLEQESNRQRTMEGINGGLHPAVDGRSLEGRKKESSHTCFTLADTTRYSLRSPDIISVAE